VLLLPHVPALRRRAVPHASRRAAD